MQDKKKIVIGALCALIMIMAVGYALLSQQLSINGSASITSNWQVEITNITEKEKSTGTTTNNTNYTATTASFNTSLTSPGDYALYEVTVTNKGTLDAVLAAKPTVTTSNNEAITYELEGITKGDKILKNNQTDTFTIKVQYNPNITSQPSVLTSNIEVTLNYQQDLGQIKPIPDAYVIGDVVEFAGSNWRVIKDSTNDEDYVTLMKEKVLTNTELGDYAYNSTSDGMKYDDSSSTYATSKAKEFLEGTYINTLDPNKLKEIDGYKIRLITLDELLGNLGYSMAITSADAGQYPKANENVPTWVYQNFGAWCYYTMTPVVGDPSDRVWLVRSGSDGLLYSMDPVTGDYGIRPVINLLKSAIE